AYGEKVICPEDLMPNASGGVEVHLAALFGLSFLFAAVVVAPCGLMAHPLRSIAAPAGILAGTLAAGAGLVRFFRSLRAAIRYSDTLELVFSSYAFMIVVVVWWIGGLAGFLPFPFH
ncbi:MAG TPA: hypothetical protein VNM37_19105, partial [Candidatus Dormibacteraeota bacterium]|nr:hypothetical protein [Candidatus Dormibacteraeota bacterium]